jgi:hypothetical protein
MAPKGGAEGWNRTSDTRAFNTVLYRLSYLGKKKPDRFHGRV